MGKKKSKNKKKQAINLNCETSNATKDSVVQQKCEDFLSRLPDDILCRIISFLPFESSIKTSFLSTRWKNLWKISNVQDGNIKDVACTLSTFLSDYIHEPNSQSNKSRLQFNFGEHNVHLVFLASKKKLHLDFSKQELPSQFGWCLELNRKDNNILKQRSALIFVKSLYLVSVSYLTNEVVSTIVSNLKNIEHLTICKCDGLRYLSIDGSSTLQRLHIRDCMQLKSLRVKAHGLKSFRCQGLLPWIWPQDDDFHLKDAMFDFRRGPSYNNINICDFNLTFLSMINVSSLTMCRWVFEALICPGLPTGYYLLEIKELWWIDYSKPPYNSDALISFLKLCPSLERLFVYVDPKSYYMPIKNACSNKIRRKAQLGNLDFIKLDGFTKEEEELSLAIQLESLAWRVQKIVAPSYQKKGLLRKLVKVDSGSEKTIHPYKFVDDVKFKSCPKHDHMYL